MITVKISIDADTVRSENFRSYMLIEFWHNVFYVIFYTI